LVQPSRSTLGLSYPPKPRSSNHSWETALFGLSVIVYLATRLIGLERFPIYFLNPYQYNLGTSVYSQVILYLLFGKSIFVTRVVPVLVSLVAALSVGLILKQIFKTRTVNWLSIILPAMRCYTGCMRSRLYGLRNKRIWCG